MIFKDTLNRPFILRIKLVFYLKYNMMHVIYLARGPK